MLQVLLENGVEEGKILFLTVIAAPEGIRRVCGTYPRIKVLTSEIDEGMNDYHVVPGLFGWIEVAGGQVCLLSRARLLHVVVGETMSICWQGAAWSQPVPLLAAAGMGEWGDRYFCE